MSTKYSEIIREVDCFVKEYKKNHVYPKLPSEDELKPYKDLVYSKYPSVVKKVISYLNTKTITITHGFKHLMYVSTLSSYIADKECELKRVNKKQRDEVVETTTLAGLLHDIDRHLGSGKKHMLEGEKTARKLFKEMDIDNQNALIIVKNHDQTDFRSKDKILEIEFGSVFDADHFMYGWEREKIFWLRESKKNTPIEKLIRDYQFLFPLKNAWRTSYGKRIGPKFIDFGIAVAKHIETRFSD